MTDVHLVRLPFDLRAFTAWALDRGYLDTPTGRWTRAAAGR